MNDDQKKDECLVVANKDVENTEVKTEIIEEKVEGAVVAVVDMHVEAAQIHKEAAEVHIEAAEDHIEEEKENKDYLTKKISLEEPDI